jgi:hypothetical protein
MIWLARCHCHACPRPTRRRRDQRRVPQAPLQRSRAGRGRGPLASRKAVLVGPAMLKVLKVMSMAVRDRVIGADPTDGRRAAPAAAARSRDGPADRRAGPCLLDAADEEAWPTWRCAASPACGSVRPQPSRSPILTSCASSCTSGAGSSVRPRRDWRSGRRSTARSEPSSWPTSFSRSSRGAARRAGPPGSSPAKATSRRTRTPSATAGGQRARGQGSSATRCTRCGTGTPRDSSRPGATSSPSRKPWDTPRHPRRSRPTPGSGRALYQWRTKGYGPIGRRIGKHLRYSPEDVDTWVAEQEVA